MSAIIPTCPTSTRAGRGEAYLHNVSDASTRMDTHAHAHRESRPHSALARGVRSRNEPAELFDNGRAGSRRCRAHGGVQTTWAAISAPPRVGACNGDPSSCLGEVLRRGREPTTGRPARSPPYLPAYAVPLGMRASFAEEVTVLNERRVHMRRLCEYQGSPMNGSGPSGRPQWAKGRNPNSAHRSCQSYRRRGRPFVGEIQTRNLLVSPSHSQVAQKRIP